MQGNQQIQGNQQLVTGKISEFASTKVRESIRSHFNREWKILLNNFSKADCYKQFKDEVKFERYLSTIKNRKHRVTLSKFRLSDHILMIETGRHSRPAIPRAERYCPHCPDTVKCEQHFLTQCTEYNRTDLLTKFTNTCPQFAQLENKEKSSCSHKKMKN